MRSRCVEWAARLVTGLFVLAPWPNPSPRADGPAFVPGDLIVKFREGTAHSGPVARAMRAGASTAEARVVAVRLAADLGVPLDLARVTSGRELVLSVDRKGLARELARSAARQPAVLRSTVLAVAPTVLPASEVALEVQLRPGSEEARQVSAALRAGGQLTPEVAALAGRLAAGTRPVPACRVAGPDRLVLTVDVLALTRDLVERLGERPDVEYAQPSQIVKPLGGGLR
jgi:hypothetical protein